MFFIKKNTFFYFRSLFLQSLFIKKGFLAFFDGFDLSFIQKINFLNKVSFYKFTLVFLSSNFISFFVNKTGLTFFFFFKPSVFLMHGFFLADLFRFIQDSSNFFLLGFSFNNFFFNNYWYNKLNSLHNLLYQKIKINVIFFSFFKNFFSYLFIYFFFLFHIFSFLDFFFRVKISAENTSKI